jgi:N-acetyl-gamma-glutamyl-phosphate reductase
VSRSAIETTPENLAGHDIVFLALPHGASGAISAQLPADTLVVDCGADHRLVSETDWQQFYGGQFHEPWPYGMPELTLASGGKLRGRLRDLTRIAVPGCNVTAVTLALAPGLTAALLEPAGGVTLGWSSGLALLFLGVIGGPVATWAAASISRSLPVVVSSLGFLGVPVVSVALSVAFLGEAFTLSLALGGALILAGLATLALRR